MNGINLLSDNLSNFFNSGYEKISTLLGYRIYQHYNMTLPVILTANAAFFCATHLAANLAFKKLKENAIVKLVVDPLLVGGSVLLLNAVQLRLSKAALAITTLAAVALRIIVNHSSCNTSCSSPLVKKKEQERAKRIEFKRKPIESESEMKETKSLPQREKTSPPPISEEIPVFKMVPKQSGQTDSSPSQTDPLVPFTIVITEASVVSEQAINSVPPTEINATHVIPGTADQAPSAATTEVIPSAAPDQAIEKREDIPEDTDKEKTVEPTKEETAEPAIDGATIKTVLDALPSPLPEEFSFTLDLDSDEMTGVPAPTERFATAEVVVDQPVVDDELHKQINILKIMNVHAETFLKRIDHPGTGDQTDQLGGEELLGANPEPAIGIAVVDHADGTVSS